MKKVGLIACAILSMLLLIACSATQSLNGKEKLEIVEKVKTLEASEYDLYNFKINYGEYLAKVYGVVSKYA